MFRGLLLHSRVVRREPRWTAGCYCLSSALTAPQQEQQCCVQSQGWLQLHDRHRGHYSLKIIF